METTHYKFFVPYVCPSLNQLLGHPKGHLLYSSKKKHLLKAMIASGVKRIMPPVDCPVTLHYEPVIQVDPGRHRSLKSKGVFDSINYAVTYKMIEDRLVKFGLLKDDTHEYVRASVCNAAVIVDEGLTGINVCVELHDDDIAIQTPLL